MAMGIGRRNFIALLGGAAAWPLEARAQQPAPPVIGFLGGEAPQLSTDDQRAFHHGLGQTGLAEGRNAAVEYRWAEGHYDRLSALAAAGPPERRGFCKIKAGRKQGSKP
jgi:putative tryptophan/tyrosine transport system substrate-binding protein